VRPEGRLYFVNVQNVAEQIDALIAQYKPRVLALDMSRIFDIEYSALQALIEREERATGRGATVWLAGLNPGVMEVVQNSGLAERLGRERMLFNARAAIERYQALQATEGATAPSGRT
jgi:MFS superfamily sulfate permease-like transporter